MDDTAYSNKQLTLYSTFESVCGIKPNEEAWNGIYLFKNTYAVCKYHLECCEYGQDEIIFRIRDHLASRWVLMIDPIQ